MSSKLVWYVVYTKPRWEKKVAELLTKRDIENYCPLNKVRRQWHDRKKIIHEPLFTSYLFVHATEGQHSLIRQVPGIINFVYWLGKPAIVRDEEIASIKLFLSNHENVQLEKTNVNVNDHVKIIYGPLMNHEGSVVEVLNRTVKVVLPSLGYALIAEVSKVHIEKTSKQEVVEGTIMN